MRMEAVSFSSDKKVKTYGVFHRLVNKNGLDINSKDSQDDTPLIAALKNQIPVEQLKKILANIGH